MSYRMFWIGSGKKTIWYRPGCGSPAIQTKIDPNLATAWFRETMECLDEKEVLAGKPEKWEGRERHCLCHTYASNMIEAGVDIVDVSALLEHRAPSFTADTYCHVFQKSKKETVARCEKFLDERSNLETATDVCDIL